MSDKVGPRLDSRRFIVCTYLITRLIKFWIIVEVKRTLKTRVLDITGNNRDDGDGISSVAFLFRFYILIKYTTEAVTKWNGTKNSHARPSSLSVPWEKPLSAVGTAGRGSTIAHIAWISLIAQNYYYVLIIYVPLRLEGRAVIYIVCDMSNHGCFCDTLLSLKRACFICLKAMMRES